MKAKLIVCAGVFALAACRSEEPAVSTTPTTERPAVHIDSVFPVEEEIRRFKAARNGVSTSELKNAAASRDALVARFMTVLEAHDTVELRAMAIDAGEFIDLYYPPSIYSRPPYKQSPEITWLLLQQNSEKGIRRALERYGGRAPKFEGYSCKSEPRVEAANRFWEQCVIRWSPAPGAPSPLRIFGSIMEREGRFKFVSYGNDL